MRPTSRGQGRVKQGVDRGEEEGDTEQGEKDRCNPFVPDFQLCVTACLHHMTYFGDIVNPL